MPKTDMKDYQKPELIHLDDPAFDETGHGSWGFPDPSIGGNGGYRGGRHHYGGHYGGGHRR